MTPDEFAKKMSETCRPGDPECAHLDADDLMCDLLDSLGYGAGVVTFRASHKWYA